MFGYTIKVRRALAKLTDDSNLFKQQPEWDFLNIFLFLHLLLYKEQGIMSQTRICRGGKMPTCFSYLQQRQETLQLFSCMSMAILHWTSSLGAGQLAPAEGSDWTALAASCIFCLHSPIKTVVPSDSINCDPFFSL